ncbi:MAG: sulfatase-like hydrolase/transferase [Acidobacteriia bacterium]|nr:sulfatase-like hydrolase/transferase [Terriglobia bacterium]
MRRRDFVAAGLASAASGAQNAAAQRRPNILFVFADQLRAQSVGCYGNEEVKTPHIDRLASEGVLFRNTVANTPVCCPARAVMLTGKYAHKNGIVANDLRLRESEVTIAEILAGAGYRTGFIGKWHLDGGQRLPGFVPPGPRRQGFQFWAANLCSHRHFDTQYFRDTSEPIPIKKFEAEAWTDIAIDYLRQSRGDSRPFFLTVAMGPPHDPYGAPEEYMRMYDPAKQTMPFTQGEMERILGGLRSVSRQPPADAGAGAFATIQWTSYRGRRETGSGPDNGRKAIFVHAEDWHASLLSAAAVRG